MIMFALSSKPPVLFAFGLTRRLRMAKPTPERRTMTVPEAAKVLGIARSTAFRAAHDGSIPTIKIGKRLLVPVAALEKKLEGAA